jgi:carboxyl-terminal processing protease
VIHASVLIVLLVVAPARAQAPIPGALDPRLVTSVYVEALSFIEPRILDAAPISRMTVWGLRGLTALDQTLSVAAVDGQLRLRRNNQPLRDFAAPRDESAVAWANTAAALAVAAAEASPAVRDAGSAGIVQSFFDELFNHLDPYSRYVPPRAASLDRDRRDGRAGLGVLIGVRGGAVVVTSVIRDGPGDLIGIKPGDTLLSVDRRSLRGLDARAVNALIEGEEDSPIEVTWRGRDGKTRDGRAARDTVPPETVFASVSNNVLTVRVTGFSRTTDSHLLGALRDAFNRRRPVGGIIVDLRGNRGGLLRQAVSAADLLLPPGIVALTAGRAPEASHVWRSYADELGEDVPVVVIVDGRTASAAEILAAALADRGRAVVVGSTTLGKGLVQTITPLSDGGELVVSWSRILAPLGWPIQGLGLLPQVCTSRGQDATRRQLDALATRRRPLGADIAAHRGARPPATEAQARQARVACPPGEGRDIDLDAARFLVANPVAYETALLPNRAELR